MPCTFTLTFSGPAEDIVAKAEQKVKAQHGDFSGDSSSGTFNVPIPLGHISGNYTIFGQQMTINITHKGLISCEAIESFVKSNLQTVASPEI